MVGMAQLLCRNCGSHDLTRESQYTISNKKAGNTTKFKGIWCNIYKCGKCGHTWDMGKWNLNGQ